MIVLEPKLRTWDATSQQWVTKVPKAWDSKAWTRPPRDYTSTFASPFEPYLGKDTVWQRDISDMPIATKSAEYATWLSTHINYGSGFGPTSLNTSAFGTKPIQCYLVDSNLPGTNYQYISGTFPAGYGKSILEGWIPWPDWAFVPQPGQDSGLAIFDMGTGILREYYMVAKLNNYTNKWTCITGGYSVAYPYLKDWSTTNYATQLTEGTNSVVGMHNHLGFIGCREAQNEKINHAVAFTFANGAMPSTVAENIRLDGTRYNAAGPSWPSKGGDGDTPGDISPVHGQWGRIPLSVDPTPYKPLTRVLIKAAQQYGIVGTDTNNFVHAFNAEPGYLYARHFGTDPWATGGFVKTKYEAMCTYEGRPLGDAIKVDDFPWQLTEWAPRNWGKPE